MSSKTTIAVPLSLGKPSLRRRLEAYYTLVAPDQLLEDSGGGTMTTTSTSRRRPTTSSLNWLDRFDQIYAKYGGSVEGERKLADKLAKKYGTTVRLQTVTSDSAMPARPSPSPPRDEAFLLAPSPSGNVGTGVLDFASDLFDPVATVRASPEQVQAANPSAIAESSMMDRVDHCSCLLPRSDPLYRQRVVRAPTKKQANDSPKDRPPPFFSSFAAPFESGPMSVLHQAMTMKHRVRILIRYVDGIRGTITGFVVTFDKHFNVLLRDAEEVYTPRMSCDGLSNTEVELKRRRLAMGATEFNQRQEIPAWSCRQRYLRQVLIRGDNVVLVYKADDERSSWPPTATTSTSMYRKKGQRQNVPLRQRVGSPGSLVVAVPHPHSSKSKNPRTRESDRR